VIANTNSSKLLAKLNWNILILVAWNMHLACENFEESSVQYVIIAIMSPSHYSHISDTHYTNNKTCTTLKTLPFTPTSSDNSQSSTPTQLHIIPLTSRNSDTHTPSQKEITSIETRRKPLQKNKDTKQRKVVSRVNF
jgi:hypothetical protein